MDRETVLKATQCDPKRLPLQAVEAFFLSQVDGHLTLEEIAEIAGTDVREAIRLAQRLKELGAVALGEPRIPPRAESRMRSGPSVTREEVSARRRDPRAEDADPPRPDPRLEPSPRADKRRSSRKSVRSQRAMTDVCELDAETYASILALDAKLGKLDLYARLDVDRQADKKVIKRSYFALAAKFHPDRFFGKKLGPASAPLERIFKHLTEAYDTLATTTKRTVYDATLPPLVVRASRSSVPRVRTPIPRRTSKTLRADARAGSESPSPMSKPPPASEALGSPRRKSVERIQRVNAAKEIRIQARVDLFVSAAEAALKANDVVSAANNYRLALQDRDDPILRFKLEELDSKSKTLRYERSALRARAAEKEQRWSEAASLYASAHEARPDAAMAERAAHALRLSHGDLQRAMTLAERAVTMAPQNLEYRLTLAEVCLAANKTERAGEESKYLVDRFPKDARVKDLATRIAKATKSR